MYNFKLITSWTVKAPRGFFWALCLLHLILPITLKAQNKLLDSLSNNVVNQSSNVCQNILELNSEQTPTEFADLKAIETLANMVAAQLEARIERLEHHQPAMVARYNPKELLFSLKMNGQDTIKDSLLPKNKRMQEIALAAYAYLQDYHLILKFVDKLYRRTLQHQFTQIDLRHGNNKTAAHADKNELYKQLLKSNGKIRVDLKTPNLTVVQDLANELGWGRIEVLRDQFMSREDFHEYLVRGILFFDPRGARMPRHTGSAHMLQLLFLTELIDTQFGPGSLKAFIIYLGREHQFDQGAIQSIKNYLQNEGILGLMPSIDLWTVLFDTGPDFYRDFRFCTFFKLTGILDDQSSLLGLP